MFPTTLNFSTGAVTDVNPVLTVSLLTSGVGSATYNSALYRTAKSGYYSTVPYDGDDTEISQEIAGVLTVTVRSSDVKVGSSQPYGGKRHNVFTEYKIFGNTTDGEDCKSNCPDEIYSFSSTLIRSGNGTGPANQLIHGARAAGPDQAFTEAMAAHL